MDDQDIDHSRPSGEATGIYPGAIVGEAYEVVRRLGSGSSGVVYLARDIRMSGDAFVALKMFYPQIARSKSARRRVARELLNGNRIRHQNVAAIFEGIIEEGRLGLAMEFVKGRPLEEVQKSLRGDYIQIIRILMQTCEGLAAIHAAGMVHRDIKPSNILLTEKGDAKIADLGLVTTSQLVTSSDSQGFEASLASETSQGLVPGTPTYIAPEVLTGSSESPLSDLYALGVVAYELVTGKLPFKDDNMANLLMSKVDIDPPTPEEIDPDCPPELSDFIMSLLCRNPAYRCSSARNASKELHELLNLKSGAYSRGSHGSGMLDASVVLPRKSTSILAILLFPITGPFDLIVGTIRLIVKMIKSTSLIGGIIFYGLIALGIVLVINGTNPFTTSPREIYDTFMKWAFH